MTAATNPHPDSKPPKTKTTKASSRRRRRQSPSPSPTTSPSPDARPRPQHDHKPTTKGAITIPVMHHSPESLPPPDIDYSLLDASQHDTLVAVISGLSPTLNTSAHDAFARVLVMTAAGDRWKDISRRVGISWAHMAAYIQHWDDLRALYRASQDLGAIVRQMRRVDEADRRAVEGWLEPVYTRTGVKCGSVRRYSDRLLEVQLRAGDPDKYSDRVKHDVRAAVVHFKIDVGKPRKRVKTATNPRPISGDE